jgi:polyisoprenoid-binding protein YceI
MATEKWDIDSSHSSIGFAVRHMVIAKVHGRFTRFKGALDLDPERLTASKVEAEIETASIDTSDGQRDGHLRSADFFDAEKYPTIEFRSSRLEKAGGDFRLVGDLTLHGVKREIALDVEYGGRGKDPWGGDRVAFTAKTKLDRKDFGLKWNQVLEAGGVLVGETIDVTIEVEAKKKTA